MTISVLVIAWAHGINRLRAAEPPGPWVNIGPAPLTLQGRPASFTTSGRVATIAVDPKNLEHWLSGTGNGGVWETRDSGNSWRSLSEDWPTLAIGAIAFAPGDPQVIYVATGEGTGQGFTMGGLGIMKSTDGGSTWKQLAASTFVRRLRVDPRNPDVVTATLLRAGHGRDARIWSPVTPYPVGIYKSTDGGVNWNRTAAGTATALEADPANFNNQYAAIGDQATIAGMLPNGVYRSNDAGGTWSAVQGPWSQVSKGRIELALAPSNSNVLYASVQNIPITATSSGLLGLYRTDNAWAAAPTWTRIPLDAIGPLGYCGPLKCSYSHAITVDPLDANTPFAGDSGNGTWRCTNCSASPTWTNVAPNTTGVHADLHAMAWAGNRLLLGNDGGIWSTTDLGRSWQHHNNGPSTMMFYSGSLHPTNPDFFLAGPRDNPAFVHDASGWRALEPASTGEWGEAEVAMSSRRPDTDWMIAWIYGVIQRTTDGGRTSLQVDAAIDKTNAAFVAPVRKCPSDDNVFVTGTYRLWRTDNFFNSTMPSWSPNSPAPDNPSLYPNMILSVAFNAADATCNTYAFANAGGKIWLTRDGGKSWADLDSARKLPTRGVNALVFDRSSETLYAAYSTFNEITPSQPGHVFKTTDVFANAPNWKNVSPPPDVPFNALALDPENPQLVWAGSDSGLWHSDSAGAAWLKVPIPNVPVYDIQINAAAKRTYVFTYGRGAFMLAR